MRYAHTKFDLNAIQGDRQQARGIGCIYGLQTVYRGNSTLDPKHGELAYLTATAVNDCFY
jgi:hypothetical protein